MNNILDIKHVCTCIKLPSQNKQVEKIPVYVYAQRKEKQF